MFFKKYPSMEQAYREKFIDNVRQFVPPGTRFVVTEKVHGTNMSLIVDAGEVRVAKRTSVLSDEEINSFYSARKILEWYAESALRLWKVIDGLYRGSVQIFGEHFGGIYGDKRYPREKLVQKEVHYIPYTDFIVYDILVKTPNDTFFLGWDAVVDLATEYGFKTVPELFRGSLQECLDYPVEFVTKVPELYGLEPIEGNVAEGVVIKTLEPFYLPNGQRVIFKKKNEKFKEKGKVKKRVKNVEITDEQRKWVDEITKYFEESRLVNLFSKGEVSPDWKQFGKIVGLFLQDALQDFYKDNPEFLELDKKVRKYIVNLAKFEAQNFVREYAKRKF